MITREKVQELVGLFYRSTYKTFYINSEDGIDYHVPAGVFVSLGMTTSRNTIENIRDFLASRKYKADLVEICSCKRDGQFINHITNLDNPGQYRLKELPVGIMNRSEAVKELELIKAKMNPASSLDTLTEYGPKWNKLQYLVERLDSSSGWDSHAIQSIDDGADYKIYHLYVNYERREGKEYRLGILVDENNTEETGNSSD